MDVEVGMSLPAVGLNPNFRNVNFGHCVLSTYASMNMHFFHHCSQHSQETTMQALQLQQRRRQRQRPRDDPKKQTKNRKPWVMRNMRILNQAERKQKLTKKQNRGLML